jgi:hypothetical protein
MTDRSKFEQMLEYLISEEEDKAKELFHQLVVEKSREIYETILAEDFTEAKEEDEEEMDEAKEEDDEELEEASDDEEEMDENFGFEAADEEGDDEGGEVGGDATDDFMGDIEAGDEEGDMGGEGDIEDRVMDLEDALDELKAEFEKMMGDEGDMPGDEMDDMGGDDMGDEMGMDSEEPKMDSFNVSDNFMREYIEKVSNPKHGDNGDNTKSIIDNMKNDMGGTTANIAKGGEDGGKGVQAGLLKPNTKEENFGNINVPGGNAGKTAFKKKEPGHGAEKKGSGDNGDNKTSPISGLKSRAK